MWNQAASYRHQKRIAPLATTLLGLWFALQTAFVAAESKPLVIAADLWCPYACSVGEPHGFSVELIEQALQHEGMASEYVNTTFSRAEKHIQAGLIDILPATDGEFTPDLLITAEPVAYTRWVFVTRQDLDWTYQGAASLEQVRLAVVAGYSYSDSTNRHIEANRDNGRVAQVYDVDPQVKSLELLASGRVDAVLEDETVVRYWADKLGLSAQIRFAGTEAELPLYCGLNQNAAQLATLLDRGLRQMRQDGTLERLLTKYGIQHWP